jgi:hypothetical protein
LVIVTVILRRLSITFSRDDEATTSDAILRSNNVVVIGGNAHVRTWESDRYSLSFSGWKSIGIFLVGTALPTDLETGEVRVWSHLIMVALHLATITDRYR